MCKTRSHQSREMDCTRHTARQDRHALNPTPRHFHLVGVREVSKALFQLWFFWLLRSPSGFNYFPLLSSGTRVLLLFWLSDSVLVLTTPASTCLGRANHQPMQFSAWFFSVFSTPGRWRCVVSTSAAATLFPHSVLPWRGGSRRFRSHVPAVVLRQLGSQISVCSDMFPQPRARYGPHCQFVSDALWASGMRSTFLPWFLTSFCDSGFNGTWFLEASMLSEMCPQLQLSTSISPRCLRDVSKDLFHLWLFWPLRSPLGFKYFPSLSSGAGTLKLRITQCVPLPLTVRAMLPDKQDRLEVEDLALLSRSMSGAVRILASMALLLLCGIQFCAALDSCLSWAFGPGCIRVNRLSDVGRASCNLLRPCSSVFCCLSSEVYLPRGVVSLFVFYWAHLCPLCWAAALEFFPLFCLADRAPRAESRRFVIWKINNCKARTST